MEKFYPYGFRTVNIGLGTESSSETEKFRIRTCGDVEWELKVQVVDKEPKKCSVQISAESHLLPVQYIDLAYEVRVKNNNPSKTIILSGEEKFTEDKTKSSVPIANYEEIVLDSKNGFVNKGDINFEVFVAVKGAWMTDCVEAVNFYIKNENINDVKVIVHDNVELYLLKSILCIQSKFFIDLFHMKKKVELAASEFAFEDVWDFLQIAHGVDLFLDADNIETMLKMATKFDVPRIKEKCKHFLLSGAMDVNYSAKIAQDFGLWEVTPTLLGKPESLRDFKNQNWNLDQLPDDIIKLVAQRVFELSVK